MPDLLAARSQMALSLGWHIVLACFGVGFPLIVLLAEWRFLRTGDAVYSALARAWTRRSFVNPTSVLGGVLAVVVHADAPDLFAGLTHRGLPLVAVSAVGGVVSLGCVWRRQFLGARVAAVTAVLWGWAAGQYPYLLERELTIRQAAADPVTLRAVLLSLAVGAVLVVPALVALFAMSQRETAGD